MIPIIPIITALATKILDKKIPGFSQTAKEFATSKTNLGGSGLMGYGLYLLSTDPLNKIGHAYLIGGFLVTTIKDAIVKIKKP